MRGRGTQAQRAVKKVSEEELGMVYDRYANIFLERLEKTFGKKVLGEGIEGFTLENARKISPIRAQAGETLQKVIEEHIYDSGINLMKSEKYWKLLKKTCNELEAQLRRIDSRAFSFGRQEQAVQGVLSEVLVRSERIRMGKTLVSLGLKSAWTRFMQITVAVAYGHTSVHLPQTQSEFNRIIRTSLLNSGNHRDFFLNTLGVPETNPALGKKLLLELDKSDLLYMESVASASGSRSKLLTPAERALIDISLKLKLVPSEIGFSSGATSIFSGVDYKSFVGKMRNLSMEGVANMVVANKTIRDAMMRALARRGKDAAKPAARGLAAVGAEARAGSLAEEGLAGAAAKSAKESSRAGGLGKIAAGVAIGVFAYYMVDNFDKVSMKARGVSDRLSSLAATPTKKQGEFDAKFQEALKKVAPFSAHSKAIKNMLNSIKVHGRKLTDEEKLRALRIAEMRKDSYKGEEMVRFVKIAAIIQFVSKKNNGQIAMLSEEIQELVPEREQEKTARGVAEEPKSGETQSRQEQEKALIEATTNPTGKEMVESAQDKFRAAKEKLRKLREVLKESP